MMLREVHLERVQHVARDAKQREMGLDRTWFELAVFLRQRAKTIIFRDFSQQQRHVVRLLIVRKLSNNRAKMPARQSSPSIAADSFFRTAKRATDALFVRQLPAGHD